VLLLERGEYPGAKRQDIVHSANGFRFHWTDQGLEIVTRTVPFAFRATGNA
jgi:hypothetical protein